MTHSELNPRTVTSRVFAGEFSVEPGGAVGSTGDTTSAVGGVTFQSFEKKVIFYNCLNSALYARHQWDWYEIQQIVFSRFWTLSTPIHIIKSNQKQFLTGWKHCYSTQETCEILPALLTINNFSLTYGFSTSFNLAAAVSSCCWNLYVSMLASINFRSPNSDTPIWNVKKSYKICIEVTTNLLIYVPFIATTKFHL